MHRFGQTALIALLANIGIWAGPAAAQTTTPAPAPAAQCAAIPELPAMPDGAHATRAQMDAYNTRFTAWAASAGAALDCRDGAVQAARNRYEPFVNENNAASARVEAINTYWTAWTNNMQAQAQGQPATPVPDASTLGSGPVTPANSVSRCGAIAEPARPPEIAHPRSSASRARIVEAVTNYNAWFTDARTKLECRSTEASEQMAQANAQTDQAAHTQVTTAAAQWRAEVAEFNARGGH